MTPKLIAASFFTVAALTTAAGTASAGERWRYEFDDRRARHMELIEEGYDQGTLTHSEYRTLKGEQRRILRMKRNFLSGGLTWTEKQSLRYAQDAANNHIFSERNDHQKSRRWYRLAGY